MSLQVRGRYFLVSNILHKGLHLYLFSILPFSKVTIINFISERETVASVLYDGEHKIKKRSKTHANDKMQIIPCSCSFNTFNNPVIYPTGSY